MFRKILIANRGEIACRIIATARRLGIRTVAVHSTADARAAHVAMADEAVAIGPPAPADSYLRADHIIEAALKTGAEAIHPGYGFLSENPDFVTAVEAAGLTFIGPSAEAIRSMGLKDAAKALMERAGVPVVPGYHGADQDDAHLEGAAEAIGWPVLIKAVAGGGGKGMRAVARPADFAAALASARSEARAAFGNEAVLIEKLIERPRHLELQIFGDGTDAVHLYERDCSLQRRHQKVIEEAPAPGMTPEMRAAMGEAAVRAARAIGYRGAGTVEFIVDASDGLRPDRFWFMEMNTRLQVEHPVTEAVTGLDLVEWQLRIAAGEGLPLTQDRISLTGHAFEARLYAEDVPAGFLPATGTFAHLEFPETVRADTGVRTGDTISPWYDPMIAKIVTHGPTRAVALNRLVRALEDTRVAGTVTNLAFLGRLARHPGFARGEVDTGLIDREIDLLAESPAPARAIEAAALLEAAAPPAGPLAGFTLWAPLRRRVTLRRDGEEVAGTLLFEGPARATVEIGQTVLDARLAPEGWRVDGALPGAVLRAGGAIHVFAGADGSFSFTPVDPLDRAAAAGAGADVIEAPMPGLLKTLAVSEGEHVAAGQPLAVLEAMKMEHMLAAPRAGIVAEVLAAPGAQVEAGAALIRLTPEEEDA
ncbi:acetyl/propionyl/methylcrotonyl-CoA carboxylase subunit alpha [Rhodovulum sulfidophilum]|uniref:acetyl/propionyl/methylcrotonyl-CoA carboxylase subunit alpha n=1 Tax=Rhodovulum sulfidophilum TaxID=35806 RepID=UPI001922E257|nr:biotin carboxylase N-terminal domain-containing protein [Rhodovulum sulfidophilum]MBL3562275.1 biotin/lipoyl-binding protein [Rhodovulum sulfidophilum]